MSASPDLHTHDLVDLTSLWGYCDSLAPPPDASTPTTRSTSTDAQSIATSSASGASIRPRAAVKLPPARRWNAARSKQLASASYTSAPQYSTQLPMAGRHRVTTTLWEDEGTLCFQVDARGVCVARRHDNNMINGTKLLNVCGMSRGKRDGILKNEKERVVVKVGAMHLKGVWITFTRGKQLAEQNGISEVLYPLFETNIQSFLYHPDNYPRTAAVMAAAQERHASRSRVPGSPGHANGAGPGSHRPSGGAREEDGSAPLGLPGSNQSWGHPPASTTQHHSGSAGGYNSNTASPHLSSSHQAGAVPGGAQGYGARPASGDRRHSNVGQDGHAGGHAGVPYGLAQPSPNAVPGGARRSASGLKRSYDEHGDSNDSIAPPAPAPGMAYGGLSSNGSNGSLAGNGYGHGGESPRMYKRGRDNTNGHGDVSGDYSGADADVSRSRPQVNPLNIRAGGY
ncbi:hypothetical protein IE81DRAFT_344216 [Ceraceosorus guamensis]|uniref:HTH APSES-type domain-containing protein n=1 Tax=Ceraceosorus guamensis TaxID=1522189 RepID=A0A316W8G1_9BASI|nr:hypothetical protein IE81DRAFT_344216 [Ceraceosorus guamensis]PWN46159.1 hypothetical protein IE81DRAFT_344216 [Ceraceosorus guamensis]